MQKKKIVLKDLRMKMSDPHAAFSVEKLTNSTSYTIGQLLSKSEVEGICQNSQWTVEIIK